MPETVTIQLSDGQPFTAMPTEDGWVMLPLNAVPSDEIRGEVESIQNACSNASAAAPPETDRSPTGGWLKHEWRNGFGNAGLRYAIRPTEGRSWSDIGLAEQPAPSAADPRISALEAENRALRWAASRGILAFCTDNEGNQTYREAGSEQWKPVDLLEQDHFLLARAAMERKP